MEQSFTFFIDPVPASRARVSKYGTYYLPTYRKFKAEMQEIVAANRRAFTQMEGPLMVTVMCFVRKPKSTDRTYPRGDVDNYAKAALDSLNGVMWEDDDQIMQLAVFKEFCEDDKEPRIYVEVEPVFKGLTPRKVRKLCSKRTRHTRRQPSRVRRRS